MSLNANGQKLLNHLAGAGELANASLRNKDADEIMLATGGTILSRGVLYNIKCTKLSPGVCRLTLQRAN